VPPVLPSEPLPPVAEPPDGPGFALGEELGRAEADALDAEEDGLA
jgi:hypothetical protein